MYWLPNFKLSKKACTNNGQSWLMAISWWPIINRQSKTLSKRISKQTCIDLFTMMQEKYCCTTRIKIPTWTAASFCSHDDMMTPPKGVEQRTRKWTMLICTHTHISDTQWYNKCMQNATTNNWLWSTTKDCTLTEWLMPHMKTLSSGSLARNRRNFWRTALMCFPFCLVIADDMMKVSNAALNYYEWTSRLFLWLTLSDNHKILKNMFD